MNDVLDRFAAPTAAWFADSFPAPTAAQAAAWEAIAGGHHALVVAPTGSGKTLAAFLAALDRLATQPPATDPALRTRVLYISPLKALAVDVERNLRAPLIGIAQTAARLGHDIPETTVGVRSGDTDAAQRRRLVAQPPDILITTPESLYLILTSGARETLRGVETVIVDEVHAIAGSKRGAHLALSLERLDDLLARPAQRIGLSATVRPHDEVARFLGGAAPVTVVAPEAEKRWDLSVVVPVADMTRLDETIVPDQPADPLRTGSMWPHVEERIVDLIEKASSTIVFANSRRLAERLTARLNEIHAERNGLGAPADEIPAQIAGASGMGGGVEPILARAHHGSVSHEQRALIEDDLKAGRLPCVVATSSLELGIDMGAVDLVIQVEPPPSVASGLQRVGRAGHHVGEVSVGVVFPKHRGELPQAAVIIEHMLSGAIESLRIPANPLDILAQQTVAATALDTLEVDDWFATVRRSAPFATLPRSAFDATLDLLAGRYPSDEFAELRPRLIWDREANTITGRPGAQRLAVTSGGTIPDRGLFGVFVAGEGAGRRVGELDEEMVYESRVGDVIALGATSWRIEEITRDQVIVTPAPGRPGRMPFWGGDAPARPAELGRALGAFTREIADAPEEAARARAAAAGFDDWATDNLLKLIAEQKVATGHVPNDRTLVVERFRDELGDWRVVLHSPFGLGVHAPWALAVGARVRNHYGVDAASMAGDDGIVVRVPDTDADPPGADLFVFEADEVERLVTDELGGSALFAARFRECAARALLLPRRNPGRRSPLWQQRQRASQLLDVARRYPTFPIVLETMRECLQDVYDVPALLDLLGDVAARRLRIVEVATERASPFAASLLFGYVAAFLYEGDSPLAERRAAALSLDTKLLAELLGRVELRELLDPEVIDQVAAELQRLAPDRRASSAEGVADLLRLLGPLTNDELAARCDPAQAASGWIGELTEARRAVRVSFAGTDWWAAVEDVARLRDALGVPIPPGTPEVFAESVDAPLVDLIARYARTHAPFTAAEVADRFGLGVSVVLDVLHRLAADGRVVEGEFTPGRSGGEWSDEGVLARLRSRSLAALRSEVEPVEPAALGRFMPAWQHVGGSLRGVDGVLAVIEQLAGAPVPASALEPLVLGSRVTDYSPSMLDELTASGEVLWAGAGALPGSDGWISLHLADTAPVTLPDPGEVDGELAAKVMEALGGGGAYFFRPLADAVASVDDTELQRVLWDLVWSGHLTNDTLAPLRTLLGARPGRGGSAPRTRPGRRRRPAMPSRTGPPAVAGRWSLLPAIETDTTLRAHARAEQLLERHGLVTRGAVVAEGVPGGFAGVYRVLSRFEESGRARRGYFVAGLGAAQFATSGVVDRLRDHSRDPEDDKGAPEMLVLAATDPAQPYGAALAWPEGDGGHRPGRKAGALVVLADGEPAVYVERGGRTVLTFTSNEAVLRAAAEALTRAVHDRRVGTLTVEKVDGGPVGESSLANPLREAGFHATPRGMRVRS